MEEAPTPSCEGTPPPPPPPNNTNSNSNTAAIPSSTAPAITIISPPPAASAITVLSSPSRPTTTTTTTTTCTTSTTTTSPSAPSNLSGPKTRKKILFSPSAKSGPSASAPEFIPASAIAISNLGNNNNNSSPNSAASSPNSSSARPPSARRRNARGGKSSRGGRNITINISAESDEHATHTPRKRGPRNKNRSRVKDEFNHDINSNSNNNNNAPVQPKAEVKLIVRRLPPRLTCDEYFSGGASERGASNAVWKSYHDGAIKGPGATSGKKTPSALKCTRHSTAYLAFGTVSAAAEFFRAENGAKYVDPKNNAEYIARVEKSPFQVVPRVAYYASKKPSSLHGTIENDHHYKKFLQELEMENELHENGNNAGPVAIRPKIKGGAPVEVSKLMEDVRARRKTRDNRRNNNNNGNGNSNSKSGNGNNAANAGGTASGTRSTRRRGRKGAKENSGGGAGTGIVNGKPILLKKNTSRNNNGNEAASSSEKAAKSKGRSSRAAKRAAAAAAAAAAGNGTGGKAEGDGVYVVRMSAPKKNININSSPGDGTTLQSPRGTPGRSRKAKGKGKNNTNGNGNGNGIANGSGNNININSNNNNNSPVPPANIPPFRLLKKDSPDGAP